MRARTAPAQRFPLINALCNAGKSGKSTGDARPLRVQLPKNKLSFLERKHLLTIVNSDEFGQLPPSQIVPMLADCGQYIASESTFYRVLRTENQLKQRRAERPAK